jgi:hypothetical protein
MLAVVEEQECLPWADVANQPIQNWRAWHRDDAEGARHRSRNQRRVGERGEIDPDDAVREAIGHPSGDGEGQPRLAHPAGTGQREQRNSIIETDTRSASRPISRVWGMGSVGNRSDGATTMTYPMLTIVRCDCRASWPTCEGMSSAGERGGSRIGRG